MTSILLRVLKTFKCRPNLLPIADLFLPWFSLWLFCLCAQVYSLFSGEVDETLNVLFPDGALEEGCEFICTTMFYSYGSCIPEYKNLPFLQPKKLSLPRKQ